MFRTISVTGFIFVIAAAAAAQDFEPDYLATFSIIARDPGTASWDSLSSRRPLPRATVRCTSKRASA
jgi:hypothetical protein